ncbi:MAG: pyridoxamine 5'-phosphate oxidase family protein [Anaerolineales bacterium]|nr:pyridoxamine 5'-phosphate oxidase family protein [Anaerolineales bacterium]
MTNPATTETVWKAIKQQLFAVLAMITRENESRSVGIVYIVHDQKLYIGTGLESWKTRHIRLNPEVSLTIPIPKRIPLIPWIKIPQATISFSGTARIIPAVKAEHEILHSVYRHMADDQELMEKSCLIEVKPKGDFITYGVGISLMQMRDPELSRGRAPVE